MNDGHAKRNIRTVRTLIVLDPISGADTTQDDEFERSVQNYEEDHDLKLDATLANVFDPAEAERAGMIIFDWGGMSLGNDLRGHQIRALTRWAEDHPSALVIIRSILSWNELQDQIRDEQLPALPNIIHDDGRTTRRATCRGGSEARYGGKESSTTQNPRIERAH